MLNITRGLVGTLLVLGLGLLSACNTAPPKDFTIVFTPSTLSIAQGASADSTLAATRTGGFADSATDVVVEGSILGTNDNQIQYQGVTVTEDSAKITFTVGVNVPVGAYDLTAKVTAGALVRTTKMKIQVKAGASVANPTNVTATGFSSSEIELNWNAVTGATGYSIEQKVGASFQKIGNSATPGVVVNGLVSASTYTFRIKAVKGTSSSSGVEVTGTTL